MKIYAHILFASASLSLSSLASHILTPGIWKEMSWSWIGVYIEKGNTSQMLPKGYNGGWLPAEFACPLPN